MVVSEATRDNQFIRDYNQMQEEFIRIYGLQLISAIGYLNLLDIKVIVGVLYSKQSFQAAKRSQILAQYFTWYN